jgi:hypothetical protein
MSDYPMLISNKLHSFRNFVVQTYILFAKSDQKEESIILILKNGYI